MPQVNRLALTLPTLRTERGFVTIFVEQAVLCDMVNLGALLHLFPKASVFFGKFMDLRFQVQHGIKRISNSFFEFVTVC